MNYENAIKFLQNQEFLIPVILKCGCTLKPPRKLLENTDIQTPSHTKLKQDIWSRASALFKKLPQQQRKSTEPRSGFSEKSTKLTNL